MNNYEYLKNKIEDKTAIVGVIGLGYVGLPLALEFAKAGYTVYGFDINEKKVQDLLNGESYIIDVPSDEITAVVKSKNFIPTTDFSLISILNTVSICVPTPLTKSQDPDMSYVISAASTIKSYMHPGLLITLESTTYPGTTEDLIEKELEIDGYKVGEDYFLCFSPERVDPGNKKFNTKNTPKVLGGTTSVCTELGVIIYSTIIERIVPVSSPKVAEMSKLLENTFRSINIAFINEMAMLCDKLGIDIWETIDAASTKPFGYMKFTPGPGIGGHCIPLDPMYLSWKAKEVNFYSRFIELAQEVNKTMPSYVLSKVGEALNNVSKPIRGSKVLILGMAYKPDIDDLRESPSLEVYELLKSSGAEIEFHDPHAKSFIDKNGVIVHSSVLNYNGISDYDCVLLLTNHTAFDYKQIEEYSQLIVDTRDAFREFASEKVFKIGRANNIKQPIGNLNQNY